MDDLYEHPAQMLDWFGEEAGVLFLAQLGEWLEDYRKRLEKEIDTVEIYRLQGRIDAYKTIVKMPEDIKTLARDKMSGKRKP